MVRLGRERHCGQTTTRVRRKLPRLGALDPAGRLSTLSDMPEPPPGVTRDYPLARLTTIRTGGHAEFFARPGTLPELEALVRWAAEAGIEVGVVGSGSNLLVA